MSKHTLKLTDVEVLTHARETLKAHLPLAAEGTTCTTDDLYNVLLGVAVDRSTIESTCADLVGTPDAETIRYYVNAQLCVEDLPALEQRLNAALVAEIPRRVWRRAREVAMDCHDRPYYGKLDQASGLWVRGRARDGTTRFYRIATAYMRLKGLRVTLAVRFVLPKESMVTVVDDLLNCLKKQGVHVRCLYLDKGFDAVAVQVYLTQRQQPAVIACTIRGKSGGTRALCRGRQSYHTTYTFANAEHPDYIAHLVVCRAFTSAKRTKRLKRRATWLIFILIHLDWSPDQARQRYRCRFGIESSYRGANRVRGWTTSNNPAYRFVLMALGFFLLNVWLHLRWLYTQVPRRGSRYLAVDRFQLTRLAKFIWRALERCYGSLHAIDALAPPRL